jgi:hypothetical protein
MKVNKQETGRSRVALCAVWLEVRVAKLSLATVKVMATVKSLQSTCGFTFLLTQMGSFSPHNYTDYQKES